jgi:alanine dehydrogenase
VTGRAGRISDEQVTLFGGGGMGGSAGLGVQFAAAAAVTYRKAKQAGLGVELPGDWFLEDMKP